MTRRPQFLKVERWKQQGQRCYWCGCPTIMHQVAPGEPVPDNAATTDHVYPVWHPKRIEYKARQTPSPFVIACRGCNNKRGGMSFRAYHELIGKPFTEPKAPSTREVRRIMNSTKIRGFNPRRRRQ